MGLGDVAILHVTFPRVVSDQSSEEQYIYYIRALIVSWIRR